jgi:hypothetical protein
MPCAMTHARCRSVGSVQYTNNSSFRELPQWWCWWWWCPFNILRHPTLSHITLTCKFSLTFVCWRRVSAPGSLWAVWCWQGSSRVNSATADRTGGLAAAVHPVASSAVSKAGTVRQKEVRAWLEGRLTSLMSWLLILLSSSMKMTVITSYQCSQDSLTLLNS